MTFKTAGLVSFKRLVSAIMFSFLVSVIYTVILCAIAFKLSPQGVFAAVFIYYSKILKQFSMTPVRRPAQHKEQCCILDGV